MTTHNFARPWHICTQTRTFLVFLGISFFHWKKYQLRSPFPGLTKVFLFPTGRNTWPDAIACARVCNLWIFACKLGRTVFFSTACAHHPFDVQDWSCPWHRTVASRNMLLRFCLVTKQLTLHYFLSLAPAPTVVRYYNKVKFELEKYKGENAILKMQNEALRA